MHQILARLLLDGLGRRQMTNGIHKHRVLRHLPKYKPPSGKGRLVFGVPVRLVQ